MSQSMGMWFEVENKQASGNSAVLCTLPFGSLNRRTCGLLTLAQISQGKTSHIPGTLGDIAKYLS